MDITDRPEDEDIDDEPYDCFLLVYSVVHTICISHGTKLRVNYT